MAPDAVLMGLTRVAKGAPKLKTLQANANYLSTKLRCRKLAALGLWGTNDGAHGKEKIQENDEKQKHDDGDTCAVCPKLGPSLSVDLKFHGAQVDAFTNDDPSS